MNEKQLPLSALDQWQACPDRDAVRKQLSLELAGLNRKIVVLDDDPTGIQTVHDVYVYTDWSAETLRDAFRAPESMFFILTNSRGFSRQKTIEVHTEIARNIAAASREAGTDYILISRSDSTLRGHYPTETQTLRVVLEKESAVRFDGEILIPFFPEGGRYTMNDVHYVAGKDGLTPAGQTEFAKDRTFGYTSSNLKEYVEEKHAGAVKAQDTVSIGLDVLRAGDTKAAEKLLKGVSGFGKVIVNAVGYVDLEVFAIAFVRAVRAGKRFMFRSAAAITKVLGGVSDKPLLTREELRDAGNRNGGLIVAGSHVNKTTLQLEQLRELKNIRFIEFDVTTALQEEAFRAERSRVLAEEMAALKAGETVAVYTSRKRLDAQTGNPEDDLKLSLKISEAVTSFVEELEIRPRFIVAKGGITSSEVGTKGLRVRRARVMGQILPGVPVWQTGPESRFPGLPYVIFPGNVGDENALRNAVEKLI